MPSATGFSIEAWYVITFVIATASGVIGYFLKQTMTKVESHDKDINVIKQTYVTDDQMKDVKDELNDDIKQLTLDVTDIKENFLKQQDFYRVQAASDKKLDRMQESTEGKLDKMYDLILKISGGIGNGK